MISGPAPLYQQVLAITRRRIESGEYAVGTQLPTDEALVREFGVGRQTVRAALQHLVAEGAIERFAGRGTFVRRRPAADSPWVIGSIEDLIGTSFADRWQAVSARFVPARRYPTSATLYGLQPGGKLFVVRGVRSAADGPYSYSDLHFPPEIGEKLPRHLFGKKPLILLVEEYCSVRAHEARQSATAVPADREVAVCLGVRLGTPLLVLERTYYARDGRPLEWARIRYRPDRFRHVARFLRSEDVPYIASRRALRSREFGVRLEAHPARDGDRS